MDWSWERAACTRRSCARSCSVCERGMNMLGHAFAAFWPLLANSSGFLLLGLFAAGVVHVLSHRFESLRRSAPRGLKAIGLGVVAGLPLPVCSCGIVPIAVALKRRHAHPETVAS